MCKLSFRVSPLLVLKSISEMVFPSAPEEGKVTEYVREEDVVLVMTKEAAALASD